MMMMDEGRAAQYGTPWSPSTEAGEHEDATKLTGTLLLMKRTQFFVQIGEGDGELLA